MLRAMDSAVAGLRAHQNKLDVIGNNIANVNTFGFKAQSFSFKDTMYQTSTSSAAGSIGSASKEVESGGVNGAQYGYGSLQGSIATDFTSSTPSYVGGFNASINGSGFFVTRATNGTVTLGTAATDVNTNSAKLKQENFSYTRVGQFTIDANGYMVDANGNFIYGFRPNNLVEPTSYTTSELVPLRAPDFDATDLKNGGGVFSPKKQAMQLKSVTIGNDGVVKATIEKDSKAVSIVLGKVAIADFQNQEGLMKAGNNTFNAAAGDNTGTVTVSVPGGAVSTLMGGYLEASNVDLAKEFSDMITTQRGFQANSKIITVSDEVLQELVNMKR